MKKPKILWYLATFTTFRQLYAAAYGFEMPTTCKLSVGNSEHESVIGLGDYKRTGRYNLEEAQWSATIERLWYAWRAIGSISALILQ